VLSSVIYGLQPPDWTLGRVPDGGANWSLTIPSLGSANVPASLGDPNGLKINEWLADPASGEDWFEVYNPNAQPVNLSGLRLTDDLNNRTKFQIAPLSFIGAGVDAFQRFDADNLITLGAEHVNFKLGASGEALGISTAGGLLINGISFGPQVVGVSEGRLPDGSANIIPFPGTGSPGRGNFLPLEDIVINEILAHTDLPLEDAVELHNRSGDDVDISGWFLSDSQNNLRKFQIPANTVIRAGSFTVLYEVQFNGDDLGEAFSFSSAKGDEVYLSQAVGQNLTGYRAVASFGASQNGVSLGRYVTSVGVDFTAMSSRTFGSDNPLTVQSFRSGTGRINAYPQVGPVVISEIMYHHASDDDGLEFIELQNIATTNVSLFDPAHPENTWRLRKGVDLDFPPGTVIPAGQFLVLVSFDPLANPAALALFRAAYGPNAVLLGPYSGKLDNAGELIELLRPDAPQTIPGPDFGLVPYLVVDHVAYDDQAPWPLSPDGEGDSLHRLIASEYGNDPVNWIGTAPDPGSGAASSNPDRDGDGMPNTWELQFGLDPDDSSDAQTDLDHDGVSNLNEFRSGTDPSDFEDVLSFDSIRLSGSQVLLRFKAVAGKTYSVLFRAALSTGVWTKLQNVAAPSVTGTVELPDQRGATQRFYRLVTPAVP
ncbi:MAG TPA: lamin tail domain-containing protein, partial [Verrucomicrobiae bacterium]|nr:lamin tail domain-containing protein [Verrucomicrobiae bacterium]